MDPAEFYTLAPKMIVGGPSPGPAQCRTAIGRAYYAALNRADETLVRWGVSCGKGPQKHGLAVRFLHATGDPDLMAASTALNDLKTLRNRADYEMNDTSVESVYQAKVALEFAKDCDGLPGGRRHRPGSQDPRGVPDQGLSAEDQYPMRRSDHGDCLRSSRAHRPSASRAAATA